MRIKALTESAITVASPTPNTPSSKVDTKIRLRIKLSALAIASAINGVLVSPLLRKIAASKL